MSPSAARRLSRPQRHICRGCGNHPARFRFRGEVRADRDHTLCFRCYRAELDRQRARRFRLNAEATFRLKAEATGSWGEAH